MLGRGEHAVDERVAPLIGEVVGDHKVLEALQQLHREEEEDARRQLRIVSAAVDPPRGEQAGEGEAEGKGGAGGEAGDANGCRDRGGAASAGPRARAGGAQEGRRHKGRRRLAAC